jgi:hypothetical protein
MRSLCHKSNCGSATHNITNSVDQNLVDKNPEDLNSLL